MRDQELTPCRRMIEERRVGTFVLERDLVEGRPTDVMALLATTLVIRCEMRADYDGYEYSAYCAVFDPLARHGWPPRYEVAIAPDSISFVPRVPPGMALVGEAKRQHVAGTPSAGMPDCYLDANVLDVESKPENYDWRAPVNDRNGGRG